MNPSKTERLDDHEIEFLHQALPIIDMRPTSSNVGIRANNYLPSLGGQASINHREKATRHTR